MVDMLPDEALDDRIAIVGTAGALRPWHRDILAALDERGGFLSRDVGKVVWPSMSPRTRSQAARMHCEELERRGLVGRLDDEKPVAWVRTSRRNAGAGRCLTRSPGMR